jgi:hypothetical protein
MEQYACLVAILVVIAFTVILVVIFNLGNRRQEKKAVVHCKEKHDVIESKLIEAGFETTSKIEYQDVLETQNDIHGKYRDSIAKEYMNKGICFSKEFRIDSDHKKIALSDSFNFSIVVIAFKDILECKLVEDNSTIMEGGVGRAVVGGFLAGGAGAIVGASTRGSKNVVSSMQLQIITNNVSDSFKKLDIITKEIPRDSIAYQKATEFAQKAYASLTSIIKQENPEPKKEGPKDSISKLKELSDMLEKGHLSKEEFNKQKKKLLDQE